MRILVTGATGQLGYDVLKELKKRGIEAFGISSKELDIANEQAVLEYILMYRPDAVIHCGAYTAVDKAEDYPDLCRAVNSAGTRYLARACKEIEAQLIYISTDYVFPGDGEKFYEPEDEPRPSSIYGLSKLEGEKAVQEILTKYFIVRISWVFGINGNNFVKTMLRLGRESDELNVVCDQIGSPTYTADLAPLLCDMIMTDKYGIYHATNEGVCSWAEFASEIFRLAGMKTRINFIPTSAYPTRAMRPLNSRLSKDKLERECFKRLPHWRDALKRYLGEI